MTIVDRQFPRNRLSLFAKPAFKGAVPAAAQAAEPGLAGAPDEIVDRQFGANPLPLQQNPETSHG